MSENKKLPQNRIAELRNEKHLSQAQLAKETGLTRQAISLYEINKREPKLETWITLADFFNVPVSYLQGISNVKDKKQFQYFKKFETYFRKNNDATPIKKDGHLVEPKNMINAYNAYFREKNIQQLTLAFNTFILNSPIADDGNIDRYKRILKVLSNSNDDFTNDAIRDTEDLFKIGLIASSGNKQAQKVIDEIGQILADNIKIVYKFEGIVKGDS